MKLNAFPSDAKVSIITEDLRWPFKMIHVVRNYCVIVAGKPVT